MLKPDDETDENMFNKMWTDNHKLRKNITTNEK